MKKFLFSILILGSQATMAHRVGNGGDHIRATFIKVGQAVVQFLKETEQGSQIAKKSKLNLASLEASLDVEKISVVEEVLRDNSGSVVEAIGEPGFIRLQKESWFRHFEKDHDVTYLVFHEMLRSASVNDDNFTISSALNPFPLSLRVETRVVPTLPLIKEDNLAGIFDLSQVQIAGSGCPTVQNKTRVEFNEEKNLLEVQLNSYRNDVWEGRPLDRKSCSLTIPVKLAKNKRLVISQIDLLGKVDLLAGSQSQLQFEAFLAGSAESLKTRLIKASENMKGRILTRRTEVLKSRCGESDNVRINTNLQTRGGRSSIESSEVEEIALFLSLEDC
jgi:hypothetical protein